MKTPLLAVCCGLLLAGSAVAGRVAVYVNTGWGGYGCAPRVYAPPVCYTPRVASYCAPTVYYRRAPVYYYSAAPVVYAPACAPVYRAPIITGGVNVSAVSFGWRR